MTIDNSKIESSLERSSFWESLPKSSYETLKNLGCSIWDNNHEGTLMLFPCSWYDYIPDDFQIVDINFNAEKFKKGVTDDDRRFGYLAYGIMVK